MDNTLFVFLLMSTCFGPSEGIECYVCSHFEEKGSNYFTAIQDDNCKDGNPSSSIDCGSGFNACVKLDLEGTFTFIDNGISRTATVDYVERGCSTASDFKCEKYDDPDDLGVQLIIEDSFGVTVESIESFEGEVCACEDDKCNSSGALLPSLLLMTTAVVWRFVK